MSEHAAVERTVGEKARLVKKTQGEKGCAVAKKSKVVLPPYTLNELLKGLMRLSERGEMVLTALGVSAPCWLSPARTFGRMGPRPEDNGMHGWLMGPQDRIPQACVDFVVRVAGWPMHKGGETVMVDRAFALQCIARLRAGELSPSLEELVNALLVAWERLYFMRAWAEDRYVRHYGALIAERLPGFPVVPHGQRMTPKQLRWIGGREGEVVDVLCALEAEYAIKGIEESVSMWVKYEDENPDDRFMPKSDKKEARGSGSKSLRALCGEYYRDVVGLVTQLLRDIPDDHFVLENMVARLARIAADRQSISSHWPTREQSPGSQVLVVDPELIVARISFRWGFIAALWREYERRKDRFAVKPHFLLRKYHCKEWTLKPELGAYSDPLEVLHNHAFGVTQRRPTTPVPRKTDRFNFFHGLKRPPIEWLLHKEKAEAMAARAGAMAAKAEAMAAKASAK